jgi:MFS family permease
MDDRWPRSRAYVLGSLLNWAFFLAAVCLLSWGSRQGLSPLLLWAVALLLALSVAAQFAAAYRLVAAQDEYLRAITAKRIIAAAGLTLSVAVLAGAAGQFLGAPSMPMWVLYPFFWGAFGIVTPLVRTSRP